MLFLVLCYMNAGWKAHCRSAALVWHKAGGLTALPATHEVRAAICQYHSRVPAGASRPSIQCLHQPQLPVHLITRLPKLVAGHLHTFSQPRPESSRRVRSPRQHTYHSVGILPPGQYSIHCFFHLAKQILTPVSGGLGQAHPWHPTTSATPAWMSPCGVPVRAVGTRRRSVTRYSACLRATSALVSISHVIEPAQHRDIQILLISRSYITLLLCIVLSSAIQPMGSACIYS